MRHRHKPRPPRSRHDSIIEAYDKAGKTLLWSGRLVDLSSGGACFFTTMALNVGDQVFARVRVFGEGITEMDGRIVWARKEGSGSFYGLKSDSVTKHHYTR